MDIVISASKRNPIKQRIKQLTIGKIKAGCERLKHIIRAVDIRLDDLAGPKGEACKRCLLVARLADGGTITIDHRSDRVMAAVGQAIGRLRGQLAKNNDRRTSHSRLRVAG